MKYWSSNPNKCVNCNYLKTSLWLICQKALWNYFMLFCPKYSILNLHIDVFKNWMTHYLFGKAFLAWLSGWPRLINIKTGTRRITRPYELSSVVLPSRRATKDYSSSRIMHLVPVTILEKKNRTNCFVCLLFVCFFTAVATNLAICLTNMPTSARVQATLLAWMCHAMPFKTFSLKLILW